MKKNHKSENNSCNIYNLIDNGIEEVSQFIDSLDGDISLQPNISIDEVRSVPAKINIQTRDKVSLSLVNKDVINQGEQLLSMEKKGNQPVTTTMNVTLDIDSLIQDDSSISIIKGFEFDYFDKAVFDAFCSLLCAGNRYISLMMIARCMSGKDYSYHPSATTISNIQKSMKKMIWTEICIDYSEEFYNFEKVRDRTSKKNNKLVIKDRLLNVRYVTACVNGIDIEAYQPVTIPALLQYASMRQQVNSFDASVLSTPCNKNRNYMLCQYFLIQRICTMKNSSMIPRTILFEKIYSVSPDFEQKQSNPYSLRTFTTRLRKAICMSLDYWKEINFIKDFKILSEGNVTYHKILIELYEDK